MMTGGPISGNLQSQLPRQWSKSLASAEGHPGQGLVRGALRPDDRTHPDVGQFAAQRIGGSLPFLGRTSHGEGGLSLLAFKG